MTSKEYRETDNFLPNSWVNRLFKPPIEFAYQLMIYVFIFGSVCHLWLADAWTGDWFVSNIIFVVGLAFLLLRSSTIGWLLTAIASAIPLLFHRDVLTQSVLLLAISGSGFWFQGLGILKPSRLPDFEKRHLGTVAWVGMIAYCFASLHKLNRDFLSAQYSCAVYGFDKLETYYSFTINGLDSALPYMVIAVEISIPILYILKKKFAARVVAILFHIPLTLTMAPAFVFVMAISHAAFIDEEERGQFKHAFLKHWKAILSLAFLTTTISLAIHGSWPEWTMVPREFLLWLSLFWTLIAWKGNTQKPHPHLRPSYPVLAIFVLNCFSPYLGVQYQHSAAMLSNLRIDKGCWNSSVFPESIRLSDDYVRVEKTYFVEPDRIEEYENIVLDQLWSPPQMRQMRRNWCSKSIQPFYLEGTYKQRKFVIEDLCNEEEKWPFDEDGIFGISLFDGALRFQKNLNKVCPQACLH